MTEESLKERVAEWLVANNKKAGEVLYGYFPLGMVARWIERAEQAEFKLKNRTEPKGE